MSADGPPKAPSLPTGEDLAAAAKNLAATSASGDRSAPIVPGTFGGTGVAQDAAPDNDAPVKTLLVVDYCVNWYAIFKGATLSDGTRIKVEQTRWKYMSMVSSSQKGVRLHLDADPNPYPFSSQREDRFCEPDFVLVRNFPTGLNDKHHTNMLMGLMFAGLPAVNSLQSIFMGMQRALVYAEMHKIGRQPGDTRTPLPLIPMTYYPNVDSQTVDFTSTHPIETPCVVKVSSPHAGFGKARAMNEGEFDDIRSILKLHSDFYTTEPFCGEVEYEFRIQKIGSHYRGFKRNSDTSWKNNWGNLQFDDYELEPRHIEWIDNVSMLWGGLDILALDVLKLTNGEEVILELNDSACGFMWEHEEEDTGHVRDLVVERMNEWFFIPPPAAE